MQSAGVNEGEVDKVRDQAESRSEKDYASGGRKHSTEVLRRRTLLLPDDDPQNFNDAQTQTTTHITQKQTTQL